jgi:hypothetical protein
LEVAGKRSLRFAVASLAGERGRRALEWLM